MCHRMAKNEEGVDILYNLHKIREHRPNLVDNSVQYKLAHLVLLECLFDLDTGVLLDEHLEQSIAGLIQNVPKQMQYIKDTEWHDSVMRTIVADVEEEPQNYPEKNRFQEIVPGIISSLCANCAEILKFVLRTNHRFYDNLEIRAHKLTPSIDVLKLRLTCTLNTHHTLHNN